MTIPNFCELCRVQFKTEKGLHYHLMKNSAHRPSLPSTDRELANF